MSEKIEGVIELLFSGLLRKHRINLSPDEEKIILTFIKETAINFDTVYVLERTKQRLNRCLKKVDSKYNREVYDIIKSIIDDITMKRVKYE